MFLGVTSSALAPAPPLVFGGLPFVAHRDVQSVGFPVYVQLLLGFRAGFSGLAV